MAWLPARTRHRRSRASAPCTNTATEVADWISLSSRIRPPLVTPTVAASPLSPPPPTKVSPRMIGASREACTCRVVPVLITRTVPGPSAAFRLTNWVSASASWYSPGSTSSTSPVCAACSASAIVRYGADLWVETRNSATT